jgi:hypothetical protein
MRWRAVASRIVVVAAAAACLATQPPRWRIAVATTPAPRAAPGKGLKVVVEASKEPALAVRPGQLDVFEDLARPRTAWTGSAEFILDPGAHLAEVSIEDRCTSGGGLCSGCDPPPGAFVRVASTTDVDVWSTSADSSPIAITGDVRVDVEIDATRQVVVRAAPTAAGPWSSCSNSLGGAPVSAPGAQRWSCWVGHATSSSWIARATIRGVCAGPAGPSPAPCTAPPSEKVAILSAKVAPP